MDAKERVRSAIAHKKVDRVPTGEIVIDDLTVKRYLHCENVAFEQRLEFVKQLGLDIICLQPSWMDPAGALQQAGNVEMPDLDDWASRSDRFVVMMLDGLVGWGTSLWGYERFLVALARSLPEIDDLVGAVERLNAALIANCAWRGVSGFLLADDIAYNRGLTINPATLRRYLFPMLGRLVAQAGRCGLPAFYHSDGNINDVLEDIVGAGFYGLQGLEADAGVDIHSVKKKYGRKLCLWGNLSAEHLVLPRTGADLQSAVNSVLDAGWKDGGLIFGTSSGLFAEVRDDNLRIIYEQLLPASRQGMITA